MVSKNNGILIGDIFHKRLTPVKHMLKYKVFALMIDCDKIGQLSNEMKYFSYNRFNLFSIRDKDHGNKTNITSFLNDIKIQAKTTNEVKKFTMVCYPRILGCAFNPLTLYLGYNNKNTIELVVYEVNNTFNGRIVYVIPTNNMDGDTIYQNCKKKLYISPFNGNTGEYFFHVKKTDQELNIGIALKEKTTPILKAYFKNNIIELNDYNLLITLKNNISMIFKVILAIHYEALKLWVKGLKIKKRANVPNYQIEYKKIK